MRFQDIYFFILVFMAFLEDRDIHKSSLALFETGVVDRNRTDDARPLVFNQLDHFFIIDKLAFTKL